tara:strand:+ start:307 stop:432 length:126 start_codon:yes stop_codon:yes gene_type:complete
MLERFWTKAAQLKDIDPFYISKHCVSLTKDTKYIKTKGAND